MGAQEIFSTSRLKLQARFLQLFLYLVWHLPCNDNNRRLPTNSNSNTSLLLAPLPLVRSSSSRTVTFCWTPKDMKRTRRKKKHKKKENFSLLWRIFPFSSRSTTLSFLASCPYNFSFLSSRESHSISRKKKVFLCSQRFSLFFCRCLMTCCVRFKERRRKKSCCCFTPLYGHAFELLRGLSTWLGAKNDKRQLASERWSDIEQFEHNVCVLRASSCSNDEHDTVILTTKHTQRLSDGTLWKFLLMCKLWIGVFLLLFFIFHPSCLSEPELLFTKLTDDSVHTHNVQQLPRNVLLRADLQIFWVVLWWRTIITK